MTKTTTPSSEMAAVNGPTGEIEKLQTELASILADVLQKRNVIKKYFDDEDEEINRICSSFSIAIRRAVSQRLLNAYCYNRYPTQITIAAVDGPKSSDDSSKK
jgi:hypothetical protein